MHVSSGARVGVLAAAALVLAGCSGLQEAAKKKQAENDLRQIALAYHASNDTNHKPPAKVDDLKPQLEAEAAKVFQALKDGEYVVQWGTPVTGKDTDKTVLAYQKDVPTKGGPVAMVDGFVKQMTAEEFQAAPKGKTK
jgi:hypothetical protein